MSSKTELQLELTQVLNRHCAENGSNTPDFILAGYLMACLDAFGAAVTHRGSWYGRHDRPGQSSISYPPPDGPAAALSEPSAKTERVRTWSRASLVVALDRSEAGGPILTHKWLTTFWAALEGDEEGTP